MVYKRQETKTRWSYFISTIFYVLQLGDKFMGYERRGGVGGGGGGELGRFAEHI